LGNRSSEVKEVSRAAKRWMEALLARAAWRQLQVRPANQP
jgi:hypothetical protein